MNEKAKRNVEKIKELILPLEKKKQQMILLCVANIARGSRLEGIDYTNTVNRLTEDEINELIDFINSPLSTRSD